MATEQPSCYNFIQRKTIPAPRLTVCPQHTTKEEDPFVPTNMDLAGFWDMVHIQVEQIHTRFLALHTLKQANWVTEVKVRLSLLFQPRFSFPGRAALYPK